MKATAKLLVAALAAAGLGMVAAEAHADRGGRASVGHAGSHGGGHWGGHRGSYGGGHWGRGYYGGYRGYWGPRLGFYWGVPVAIGLGYWGYPYYWDYPRETVVYREVVREPEDGQLLPPAPAEPAASAPAPSSGPLYMNYCESAREYYPKVTRCPEGWKFVTPTS